MLDRAAWRRFQLHIDLPPPTQKDVAEYIAAFAPVYRENLGITTAAMARQLGTVSFPDLEEFCLDIRRAQILTANALPLKTIVRRKLTRWATSPKATGAPRKA